MLKSHSWAARGDLIREGNSEVPKNGCWGADVRKKIVPKNADTSQLRTEMAKVGCLSDFVWAGVLGVASVLSHN